MDAIGTLAAFAPGDLAKLQYTGAYFHSSNGLKISIPASKFIILFSPWGSININASGCAICASIIICIGAFGQYVDVASNQRLSVHLTSSTQVSASYTAGSVSCSFAFCPI